MLQMYDHLVQMGNAVPVPGNKSGSYLTAFSLQGFYTDINGIIAGFVQIFVDQSYWQSAVAASPMQAVKVRLVPNAAYAVIGIITSHAHLTMRANTCARSQADLQTALECSLPAGCMEAAMLA